MKTKSPGVVINTSPWIALCACRKTGLLPELYDEIFMPEAVRHEILAGDEGKFGVEEFRNCDWLKIMTIRDISKIKQLHELDRGESEVVVLAQEQSIGEVIIDERVARMQAHVSGLKVVGSLDLLLRSKKRGLIDKIKPAIHRILNAGIYIHKDIVLGILQEAGEQ